jgi:hypothetical protein
MFGLIVLVGVLVWRLRSSSEAPSACALLRILLPFLNEGLVMDLVFLIVASRRVMLADEVVLLKQSSS